jgi:hypothetical protein
MDAITPARIADRRDFPRVAYPLDGSCSGQSGHRVVRISDLSASGCFIESIETMVEGERVDLGIDIPGLGTLAMSWTVVNSTPRLGFSVRFVDIGPGTLAQLTTAVDALRERQGQ